MWHQVRILSHSLASAPMSLKEFTPLPSYMLCNMNCVLLHILVFNIHGDAEQMLAFICVHDSEMKATSVLTQSVSVIIAGDCLRYIGVCLHCS